MKPLHAVPRPASDKLAGFCGPTAIAALTGRRPEDCVSERMRRQNDGGMAFLEMGPFLPGPCKRQTFGTTTRTGFYNHGWMGLMTRRVTKGTVTLARFCRPGRRGLVEVYGHWLAVSDCLVVDTTRRTPTWVFDHPMANRRVRMFVEVAS